MSTNPYSDTTNESFDDSPLHEKFEATDGQRSKSLWKTLVSLAFVLVGSAVFFASAYLMLLKDPRSNDEERIGLAGWCFGSSLLGFGFAINRFNWIASAIIGFMFPGLTFGLAVVLFWLPAIIAALFSDSR